MKLHNVERHSSTNIQTRCLTSYKGLTVAVAVPAANIGREGLQGACVSPYSSLI
jgi:hypothetical protein